MLRVQATGPCLALRPYVRCYVQRTGCGKGVISVDAVVARLEQAIEFQFKTSYEVHPEGTETTRVAPLAAVIGPQTGRRFTPALSSVGSLGSSGRKVASKFS